ncbi:MAG: hypothetical protein PVS3B3_00560 [Ktedonobacteraceae bacterium]
MQENRDTHCTDMELSRTWLELLGKQIDASPTSNCSIPAFDSDPWNSLVQVQGIQTVDLQKIHLPMSDLDVEQLLHYMQDQSTQHPEL